MSRLTERRTCYPQCDKQGNLTRVDYIYIKDKKLAEEKLCQTEDIEEDWQISISVLNKIRQTAKNKGVLYAISGGDIMCFYDICEIDLLNGTIKGILDGCWHTEELKDYGKTVALTKEELEK